MTGSSEHSTASEEKTLASKNDAVRLSLVPSAVPRTYQNLLDSLPTLFRERLN